MGKVVMGFRGLRFVVYVVMMRICGGKMEKLTLGWGKL
jgi:hypothetical protein